MYFKHSNCTLAGCGRKHMAKGYCAMHYARLRIRGRLNRIAKDRNGDSYSKEYQTWYQMIRRCTNSKAGNYNRYGGRGISVCKEWLDYSKFLRDMGRAPSPTHQIDRKDNDGNYEASNCQWVTPHENAMKRTTTKLTQSQVFEIKKLLSLGKRQVDIARQFGINAGNVQHIKCGNSWKTEGFG